MIGTPIIKRKPVILSRLPNGGFDIPNFDTHLAMEYFSGNASLETIRRELAKNGAMIWLFSDEELITKLRKNLVGKERFFTFINNKEDFL